MSTHAAPDKPDHRIFASYPMPAKIDLIQGRPRRESLLEQELEKQIVQQSNLHPRIEIKEQTIWTSGSNDHQVAVSSNVGPSSYENMNEQHNQSNRINTGYRQHQTTQESAPYGKQAVGYSANLNDSSRATNARNILNDCVKNNAANLAAELAEKEAKLMAEINALHQRPYSPYQTPAKIDLSVEQKKLQMQYENAPSSRPQSRASSANATSNDLLDKEAKLLQEIEEIEKKPYNPQTMVVEREQWYKYPKGRPNDRHMTDSKRRVKDFCSLPANMYPGQDSHIHEENLPINNNSPTPGSIHTTIIRSPRSEVDNKSPLPFAFDNFTTKGVRGNIASVGAVEPERPRPPIYPILKRSPTPNMTRG